MESNWTQDENIVRMLTKPSKNLQKKAGTGTVSPEVIQRAEKVIENNTVDFVPMASEYLDLLDKALSDAETHGDDLSALRSSVTFPVMQLKANGSVFGYPVVSEISAIVLSFLEIVRSVDKDVLDILQACHQILTMVIAQRLEDDGGEAGEAFKMEVYAVCDRYMKKQLAR